jgi:probable rRNA maturation factor
MARAEWRGGIRAEVVDGRGRALVGDAAVRALNRRYRGHDAVTDVLSFPSHEGRGRPLLVPHSSSPRAVHLGDIVIARGVARRQARAAGHSELTELRILSLHGLLHLLGYDHDRDDGEMARLEERLRRQAGLTSQGLVTRAERAFAMVGSGGRRGLRSERGGRRAGPHADRR